jgi:succinate dehydrogenase (ubiquinone) cytochrome b560 subunit
MKLKLTIRFESTAPETSQILIDQRLKRPIAPHLTIYKAQITWYASGLHRITGVAIAGPLYLFSIGYLVAPYLGWHLESSVLAASFASLGAGTKIAIKSLIAWPFTFHSINGLRHLTWDTGVMFSKKAVIQSGWIGVGLSVVSALYLGFAY